MDHTFDKTLWKKVRFSDVADEHKETINGQKIQLKFYVGLDHIESESLHLTKWGNLSEGVSFSKVFRKDQILFGRRRAYQKKAAIAPFDGVCSGDILIFKPKAALIHPQFFPFVIQNDRFFDYAMQTSAGSLSPRTKFKDLANFEFFLPPLDQQKELAELLWSGDAILNSTKQLRIKFSELLDYELYKLFTKDNSYLPLKDLLIGKPQYGASRKAIEYNSNMPRYIRITDIDENSDLNPNTLSSIDGKDWENYLLKTNDILLARTADPGKSFLFNEKKHGVCVFAGYLIKFRFNKQKILPNFFFAYTKTLHYWSQIRKRMKKGTLSNINTGQFESILVPLPSIKNQDYILKIVGKYQNILETLLNKCVREEKILKSLTNEIFR